MKKSTLLFLFTFIVAFAQAQVFESVVKDAKTGDTLPYVNVGIVGKNQGTVTDLNGHFKLTLGNDDDSVRISMLGYEPKAFLVSNLKRELNAHQVINLAPKIYKIKEVRVKDHKWKEKWLGNSTKSKSTSAGFTSNQLGNEIGIIIRIKKSPTYLEKFTASLSDPVTDSVKLRLNFYTLKKGKPDQLLPERNIFVNLKKGDEQIEVDLNPYNIKVDDDFFVSLENIQHARGKLMFSASLLSSPMIARDASQGDWEKVGLVGIGFMVLVSY